MFKRPDQAELPILLCLLRLVLRIFYIALQLQKKEIYRHQNFTLTAASCFIYRQLLVAQKISKDIVKINVLGFEIYLSAHKFDKGLQ